MTLVVTMWRIVAAEGLFRVEPPVLVPGASFSLPAVNSADHNKLVVVYAEPTCRACNETLPFFHELGRVIASRPGMALAFISKTATESELAEWLEDVDFDIGAQIPNLADLGFFITPTLLIVNQSGAITDVINGTPSADDRLHILSKVRNETLKSLAVAAPEIASSECERLTAYPNTILLDIRPAEQFASEHHPSAVNVPSGEFARTIRTNLPPGKRILLAKTSQIVRQRYAAVSLLHEGWREVYVCR